MQTRRGGSDLDFLGFTEGVRRKERTLLPLKNQLKKNCGKRGWKKEAPKKG